MARFVSWLGETRQPWLVVLDDLPEITYLDGLWPEGPAGRLLITSRRSAIVGARPGTQVIPVGFFSAREAINCLTERLSANPVKRLGAIELVETLGREPLALAQASSVVASSTLDCLGYRDLFVRQRQQIWAVAGELPSAAMLTWALSLARAESLRSGSSVRLLGPAHAGPRRPARRSRDSRSHFRYVGRGCIPDRCRGPLLRGGRPETGLGHAARPRTSRTDAIRCCCGPARVSTRPAWSPRPLNTGATTADRVGLARALIMAGQPADAVSALLQAVSDCEQARGPGHPDTLDVRDELAAAYQAAGDVPAASRLLARNLTDRER